MENKEALGFFQKMAANSCDPKSVKINPGNDFTQMDACFILKYADENSILLDLGSGTGLTVNKIYDKVKYITAVEPFSSFTQFIVSSDKISIVNKTLDEFQIDRTDYDLITMFGIMHYFNEVESISLYEKYYYALKEGGHIIVKNQFGIKEDVLVEGYSEELKTNYYSSYRHINKEIGILQKVGYKNLRIEDIYPPECNRWENTHFYAIVGEK